MRAREPNSSHWTRQVCKRRHHHRQWSGSNSWPIRCHRTWTRKLAAPQVPMVRCPSTCWRWKIITSQLLMLLIRWTSGTTEWTFMTNCPHRSRHSCFACKSGVRWSGFFCVRPAYCWSQKQNDQVIVNASLLETEQKYKKQNLLTKTETNTKSNFHKLYKQKHYN